MARIPSGTRIQKEDFDADDRALIDRLAPSINQFIEQVVNALNGNLDFNNMNRQLILLEVTVDSGGLPTVDTKFRINLKSKLAGVVCINASNLTNPGTYPVNHPFLTVAQNGNIVTIKHISGLQADNKYQLRLEAIGI